MAILTEMVGQKVISGFKGVIDFYYWLGIPVARRWPRKPSMTRSPAVIAQYTAFAYIAKQWNTISPEVQEAYKWTASGSTLTGRDLQVKAFISTYFRYGQWD